MDLPNVSGGTNANLELGDDLRQRRFLAYALVHGGSYYDQRTTVTGTQSDGR